MTAFSPVRALLSRSALEENAQRLIAAHGLSACADVRRDAYGHGAAQTLEVVASQGITRVVLDEDEPRVWARRLGLTVAADDDADPAQTRTMYGLPESEGRPVMSLRGTVLSTKPLYPGEGVSYTHQFIAERATRIALVTGGYAQGILRSLGGHIEVAIADRRHPVIGRIAMDACVVDLNDHAVVPGTEVVFFGGHGTMADALNVWSRISRLSAEEIVATVGLKVLRRWFP